MKIIPKMIEGGEEKLSHPSAPKKKRFSSKIDFYIHQLLFLVKLKRKLNLIKSIWNLTFFKINVTVFYIFD